MYDVMESKSACVRISSLSTTCFAFAQEFIADVMGNVSTMEHGLRDAKDEEVFTAQLSSLEVSVSSKFSHHVRIHISANLEETLTSADV